MATKTNSRAPKIEVPADPDTAQPAVDEEQTAAEAAPEAAADDEAPEVTPDAEQSPEPAQPAAKRKTGKRSGAGTISDPMDYDAAMAAFKRGDLKRSVFTNLGWLAVTKPIPQQAKV